MMATITKISFFLSKKILLERSRPRLRLAICTSDGGRFPDVSE